MTLEYSKHKYNTGPVRECEACRKRHREGSMVLLEPSPGTGWLCGECFGILWNLFPDRDSGYALPGLTRLVLPR